MASIEQLQHPDKVNVNGDDYQVLQNTSAFYDTDKKVLLMHVELVKLGVGTSSSDFRLVYEKENPDIVYFEKFYPKTDKWRKVKLEKIEYPEKIKDEL